MMTREEFLAKYRGQHLVFLAEAWACRKELPSQMGQLMDSHALKLKRLLNEMYNDLTEDTSRNGIHREERLP